MSSFTVTFSGTTSILRADFCPEIPLDPTADYCCALLDFTTYNSIPNIVEGVNNQISIKYRTIKPKKDKENVYSEATTHIISLPTGSYEVEDILKYLRLKFAVIDINFVGEIDEDTLKVKITFNVRVDWINGAILKILGFTRTNFNENSTYESDSIVQITEIDIIRIECDIASS